MFKIGNIVRIKHECKQYKVWYTTELFTIIGFCDDNINLCYLNKPIHGTDNFINFCFIELDTQAERKQKLKNICSISQVIN